jgi:GNAT superfamily N-acetyltransferase
LTVTIAELRPEDVAEVDERLPLNRLDQQVRAGSTYLIAWDESGPVGHAHIAWEGTHLGVPEIQDVFVLPERRREGIATLLTRAAEDESRRRGFVRISLSVSTEGNDAARKLYDGLGYLDAGVPPVRVFGTIMLRGRPFEVDDTLTYLVKTALTTTQEV